MPDGHRVTLFEHDMSADGSRSWRAPMDEPERINGMPARLVVLEDPAGNAVPACPNEPVPAMLTLAQMEAMVDGSRRPCK